MTKTVPLEYNKFYHLYNRGINSSDIFENDSNYNCFWELYNKYIEPIANTYAWCLMPNHFHLLIRIKDEDEIGYYKALSNNNPNQSNRFQITYDLSEFKEPERVKKPNPTKHFSHLFNSYAKYFNKQHNRHGSLFEKPFQRKLIEDERYLKYLVYYIHHNPVHHDFTENIYKYPWSSYLTIISLKKTKVKRQEVIDWFDDLANFKYYHKQQHELGQLKDLLIDTF